MIYEVPGYINIAGGQMLNEHTMIIDWRYSFEAEYCNDRKLEIGDVIEIQSDGSCWTLVALREFQKYQIDGMTYNGMAVAIFERDLVCSDWEELQS